MRNMKYIATFYSHFGAIKFKKLCERNGWQAAVMPVPRSLSSSCGTCVEWEGQVPEEIPEEVEQVVLVEKEEYVLKYKAPDS